MPKRIRMSRKVLQVVVGTIVSWCVVPRATMAAPQCGEFIVAVPQVEGQPVNATRATLEKAGLKLGRVVPPDGNGVVFRQSVEPNRCVPMGTTIDIWINNVTSAPTTTVEVPDLRGQSPFGAALVLAIRGLRYGGSSKEQSNEVAPGKIFNQQPPAKARVPKGTAVVVTLAEAVPVPPLPPQETLTLESNLNGPAIPGELVTFTASAQGSAHTIQFRFNFGDGQESSLSDSPQARHSYAQDGNYIVTVTATLDGGARQLAASTEIGVHEAPQGVTLDVSPIPLHEKEGATFTAQVYPPEPVPIQYVFHFGDNNAITSRTPSVTYAYQQSTTYHPSVTITMEHNHKASSRPISLIVLPPLPPPLPTWMIVLIVAGVLVAVAGYKVLQRIVTGRISYNLRPGEVVIRLHTLDGGLKEGEFQFHTTPFQSVVKVEERASVVRNVEVQR